jgi:hypothetical protein
VLKIDIYRYLTIKNGISWGFYGEEHRDSTSKHGFKTTNDWRAATSILFIQPPSVIPKRGRKGSFDHYPLVMSNIAIENGPFIVSFPIKNGGFP